MCKQESKGIDECIKPLIKKFNECGFETVASCCGHGKQPTNIVLKDGREILIIKDYKTARMVEKLFPPLNQRPNEWKFTLKRKLVSFIINK